VVIGKQQSSRRYCCKEELVVRNQRLLFPIDVLTVLDDSVDDA